jgi:uncharacterized protein
MHRPPLPALAIALGPLGPLGPLAPAPALPSAHSPSADDAPPASGALPGLEQALLADLLEKLGSLPGVALVLAPAAAWPGQHAAPDGRGHSHEPRRDGLGERLAQATAALLADHPAAVVLTSHTPTLPTALLAEAIAALGEPADVAPDPAAVASPAGGVDLVLGPTWDGGCYLVGVRAPQLALFQGLSEASPGALAQLASRAQHAGLRVHFLPAWYRLETAEDLERLHRDLRATPAFLPGYPRQTAACLAGVAPPREPAPRDELWRPLSTRRAYQNRWL